MRRLVCCIGVVSILLGLSMSCVYAQNENERIFVQANALYEKGQYEEAIDEYKRLIENEYITQEVCYNIGNAYFKVGELGEALLWYERARRYMPHDEDVLFNIHLTESLLKQKQPVQELNWYQRFFTFVRDSYDAVQWFWIICAVYCAVCVLMIMGIYVRWFRMYRLLIISIGVILLLIVSLFGIARIYVQETSREAIVLDDDVAIRYSPVYTGSVAFQVDEGIRVRVLRELDEWAQVEIVKGKGGWVEKRFIEEV